MSHEKGLLLIYSELKNYLTMASSAEEVKVFDDAVVVFEKYGLTEYMDMFEDVSFNDPDANDVAVVDSLKTNLLAVLNHLLVMQGLHRADHMLPSQVVEFADAMYMVVDYEDRATVEQLLEADMPVQELAAEILALLTPYSVDEVMGLFESVDDNFRQSLKNRLTDHAERKVPEELASVEPQLKAYAAYKDVVGHEQIYPDKFYGHVGIMGMSYKDYLNMYQADNAENDLTVVDPRLIAKDLVGMAFLSCDGVDNPLITVRKHLNELFADMNITTKVDVAVSKLTVEVSHAQA